MIWHEVAPNNPIRAAHDRGEQARVHGPHRPPPDLTGLALIAWWTGYRGTATQPENRPAKPQEHASKQAYKGLSAISGASEVSNPQGTGSQSPIARFRAKSEFQPGTRVRQLLHGSMRHGTVSIERSSGCYRVHWDSGQVSTVHRSYLEVE